MNTSSFQALVVDDDPIVRKIVGFALNQEGFGCEYAADGNEALHCLNDHTFDVVVTDLSMPNRHGHSLAIELLSRPTRPLIIVHSSIDDPRLTKDLMLRGVDDIVYKPAKYDTFAAKVAGMVKRKRSQPPAIIQVKPATEEAEPVTCSAAGNETESDLRISLSELQSKLADVSKVLPVSHAANDICDMVLSKTFNAEQVAKAIEKDHALADQVLHLANIPFYNDSGRRITDVKQAVVRVGQKRVGELAMAMRTFSSISPESLPWMDLELAWRRSVAAGIACEILVAQGGHSDISEGLLFSALMHNAGRIVLGTHFPDRYTRLVKLCRDRNEELVRHETRVFPKSPAEVIIDLLTEWKIPSQLFEPLKRIDHDYSALSSLAEPTRKKSELVRLAILIGQIAVGAWEDWDSIDFPPTSVLDRLRIVDVRAAIDQTKIQLRGIEAFRIHPTIDSPARNTVQIAPTRINYYNRSPDRFDFLETYFPSMGLATFSTDARPEAPRGNVLVNRIGATPDNSTSLLFKDCDHALYIRYGANVQKVGGIDGDIALPCSYSLLRTAFQQIVRTS